MKLKHNPFPLIFAQGDEATKLACLDFFGLSDSPPAKDWLLQLIKLQRSDGAFPSSLDPENWGTRETVRNTLLLLKIGLPPEGVNVHAAVQFILNHQRPDGGWSENPSLVIPPEKVELSNEQGITWITADVVELLRQVGMGECPECKAALEWLRAMQNRHGGWYSYSGSIGDQRGSTGDPDSTAQITFLMGELYGEDDPVYLGGRELFERHLDECAQDVERGYRFRLRDGQKEELDGYTLTHLLLSWLLDQPRRIQSGYDVRDPRVKQMMEALIEIQREDGGWRPFWSEESSPVYTALAVKVLVLSGMLARDDLEAAVKAYAV
jgi:squalene cyclase